jgi:hypothetical protein
MYPQSFLEPGVSCESAQSAQTDVLQQSGRTIRTVRLLLPAYTPPGEGLLSF